MAWPRRVTFEMRRPRVPQSCPVGRFDAMRGKPVGTTLPLQPSLGMPAFDPASIT